MFLHPDRTPSGVDSVNVTQLVCSVFVLTPDEEMLNMVRSEEPSRAPTKAAKSSTALKVIHGWRRQEVFTPCPTNEAFKCNQTFQNVRTSPRRVPHRGSDWRLSVSLMVSEVVLFGVKTLNINL